MTTAFPPSSSPRVDRVPYRSRRLEALFGAPFDELRPEHVRGLVAAEAEEMFDLDFKATTYGGTERDKRDLAGDVAALANTAGGALVLGIEQDAQGRASAAPGVTVTDAETNRMSQVIAANTAPMPTTYTKKVVDPGTVTDGMADESTGFYVIVVPPSPMAPHAVLVNEGLRYPRRNGTTIRYLSEPEVAMAYRARDLGAAQQSARAADVADEAAPRLPADEPWLLVALVPDVAGSAPITRTAFDQFKAEVVGTEAFIVTGGSVSFGRALVGPRSFITDDAWQIAETQARRVRMQVYGDGSGSYAMRLHDVGREVHAGEDLAGPRPAVISDEWLAVGVFSALNLLGRHAQYRAATSGNGLLRAAVVPPAGDREIRLKWTRGQMAFEPDRAMTTPPGRSYVATMPVELDAIATGGPDLVATAARIGSELVQAFGLAEMPQFTTDGGIALGSWQSGYGWRPGLEAWASAHGVIIS